MELGTSGYREQSSCISCGINGAGHIEVVIATAEVNDVEPFAYLRATLKAIASGHPANRIDDASSVEPPAVKLILSVGETPLADFDPQVAEIPIRIIVLNRYTVLGIPVTEAAR